MLFQRRQQRALPAARLPCAELAHAVADAVEQLVRRDPVGARRLDPGVDLVVHPGDAHHEELVEVRAVDRAELHALEQRPVGVLCELQHALVEVEPRQLAVDVEGGVADGGGRLARRRAQPFDRVRERLQQREIGIRLAQLRERRLEVAQLLGAQPAAGGARGARELVGRHHDGDLAAGLDPPGAQLALAIGVGGDVGSSVSASTRRATSAPQRSAIARGAEAGVLDHVVQHGGRDDRLVAARVVQQAGRDRRVLDVGGGVSVGVAAVGLEREPPRVGDELRVAREGGEVRRGRSTSSRAIVGRHGGHLVTAGFPLTIRVKVVDGATIAAYNT